MNFALKLVLIALPLWSVQAMAAERYALEVDGLACPFCAYGIEKRLFGVEGVEDVETDIGSGQVRVIVEDDGAFTEAAARKAVEDAGFTLRGFRREGRVEQ